jgi:ketosteroid isomerase-like protein
MAAGWELVDWWIQPLAVKIYGNVAIVHHYCYYISRNPDGEEESGRVRWTDIVLKQGNRWVFIADHGGDDSLLKPGG